MRRSGPVAEEDPAPTLPGIVLHQEQGGGGWARHRCFRQPFMAVEHGSGRRIDEKIAPSRGPMVRILERTVLETNKYGNPGSAFLDCAARFAVVTACVPNPLGSGSRNARLCRMWRHGRQRPLRRVRQAIRGAG